MAERLWTSTSMRGKRERDEGRAHTCTHTHRQKTHRGPYTNIYTLILIHCPALFSKSAPFLYNGIFISRRLTVCSVWPSRRSSMGLCSPEGQIPPVLMMLRGCRIFTRPSLARRVSNACGTDLYGTPGQPAAHAIHILRKRLARQLTVQQLKPPVS